MTFNSAAWAIDGARVSSSLARRASYSESGGAEGVVSRGDLKVLPLDVPGVGLQITAGSALLLNRYQNDINETYTVANLGAHIIPSGEMPAASGAQRYYLVGVSIGDPQGSQVGHPWFTGVPAGQEETFQYVRPILVQVANANIKTAVAAGIKYPFLPLAQLRLPANTTTVTSDLLTDLRKLARPRAIEVIEHIDNAPDNSLNTLQPAWENWPSSVFYDVDIPEWAVRAKITGFVEGARHTKAGQGGLRVTLVGVGSTKVTNINESAPTSGANDRKHYSLGGEIAIPSSARGTTVRVKIEGNHNASPGFLTTDSWTSGQIRVRLEEAVI